ncbi:MAG: hypothetical protein DMG98_10660 [Acidobacteria bacterium]|nr:MAG: hypothetical protein DMG98_10660 [Acidobacteriota bacterium]
MWRRHESGPSCEYAGICEELFQSAPCFKQSDLPVLTKLALEFAVFNRWFASIPGPTICNRAFAHYGTSFGRVDMDPFDVIEPIKSIYTRLIKATPKHTAKIYYYDTASSTMEVVNLLQNQPELFGTYDRFKKDCDKGILPEYSFVEPKWPTISTLTMTCRRESS